MNSASEPEALERASPNARSRYARYSRNVPMSAFQFEGVPTPTHNQTLTQFDLTSAYLAHQRAQGTGNSGSDLMNSASEAEGPTHTLALFTSTRLSPQPPSRTVLTAGSNLSLVSVFRRSVLSQVSVVSCVFFVCHRALYTHPLSYKLYHTYILVHSCMHAYTHTFVCIHSYALSLNHASCFSVHLLVSYTHFCYPSFRLLNWKYLRTCPCRGSIVTVLDDKKC